MEAAPPSYEKATVIDLWDIVARYIPSNDLCSAALVCRRWHSTFTPHLWGNPASHFGIGDDDRVYVALTEFIQTLPIARLLVRSQTHTLRLPPAQPEMYSRPDASWLREILDRLPNLQSLIVKGLPFFDFPALEALRYKRSTRGSEEGRANGPLDLPASTVASLQTPPHFVTSFGLRLLDASRCLNVTASSLSQGLRCFESLLYLDLSYTLPAKDPIVLKALRRIAGLQVLKLRGIRLNNDSLKVLACSIARRTRSLDIRNNLVTDRGIGPLLDECFTTALPDNNPYSNGPRSPASLSRLGHEMLDVYQGEDFEAFLRNAFTARFVGRMAIEDTPEGGVTHLYISGNPVSVEGVSDLLKSARLHVLDAGSVSNGLRCALRQASLAASSTEMGPPEVEQLVTTLAKYASKSIRSLRIDHTLIIKDDPITRVDDVVQERVELDDASPPEYSDAVESDGTSRVEMSPVKTHRYALAGDATPVVPPPANDRSERELENAAVESHRRGCANAPGVVGDKWSPNISVNGISSPISGTEESGALDSRFVNTSVSPPTPPTPSLPPADETPPIQRPRTYSSAANERSARLNAHTAVRQNLHPAMLPHLKTLVLSNVPATSPTREVSNRLICFIRQCAEEAQFARHQARLDYSLPPGRRSHANALTSSAEQIFALKRLVLELADNQSHAQNRHASQWHHAGTKSVTEDHDSETLWSAAATDFSFFGDEEEAYPSLDSGRHGGRLSSNEKDVSSSSSPRYSQRPRPAQMFDNIALLSAFRKERKLAHTRNIAAGAQDPDTDGFWEGTIEVVRPSSRRDNTARDYHSMRFDHTLLYN